MTAKPCVILGNYIAGINLYLENQHRFNIDILHVKIKEIFLLLLQSKKAPEVSTLLRNLFAERTNTFKAIVESHLYNDISIDDLAILSNMSVSTFKRKFRLIYKDTPAHYILSKRLKRAEGLLSASELSMNEISDEIGFKTAHQFSKKFKERYGLTPTKFRLNQIGKKLTPIGR
ncbi:MAG: AraC family transcriptional regulator [Fulvivirga sp.]|uniref:AraC family transcriptional regulator n=1 Tax=Fulvivirga sp. TaxID=1931237 RepID=UPI0032F0420C